VYIKVIQQDDVTDFAACELNEMMSSFVRFGANS